MSLTASTDVLESIWGDGMIRSQRDLNGGMPKTKMDGTPTGEVVLKTDEDVFFFAGPFRFPPKKPGACGLIFSCDLETVLDNRKVATPFDSGGVLEWYSPSGADLSPKDLVAFVRANEMPVPDYRTFLAEFTATAFEHPMNYMHDEKTPACVNTIVVKPRKPGADARQWTFEVRCQGPVPMSAPLKAVIIEKVVANSGDWAEDMMKQLMSRGVDIRLFETQEDGDWQSLKQNGLDYLESHLQVKVDNDGQ
ncbi:MAG TPA: hypothetical protein ENH84_06225 [Phycisphaerae bacterium]|nr:hypothetical protein [Phycisphaerae bacterium]